ncbi:SGNH hydrolase-type esterase domain-containing protein [Bisporella sp. PMI_857]|nr:SGNH hydrolase-type esterase domain-containing protein [Bisporella sp. PMI_857]
MQLNSIYLQSKKLEFAACTGAVVKDVLDNVEGRSRPLSQLNLLHDLSVPAGGWATLTIGGNDVWFSKVIVKCFFAQRYAGQCNDQLERSEQEIHSKAFADKLWQTYMRILQQSTLPGFTLVVLSYPRLFNGLELRCNDKSFVTGGRYIAPKLSLEKRQRVNAAISTVNELIKQTVIEIRNRQLLERSKKRIFYYEVDNHYWYHRYCDFQNSDGTPRDWKDDAWFFTIFGDDDDGGVIPQDAERINVRDLDLTTCERKLGADELSGEEFDIACHFRAMLASDSDFDLPPPHSLTSFWPDGYKKGFHPKRVAHSEIARGIWLRWGSVWGPQPER